MKLRKLVKSEDNYLKEQDLKLRNLNERLDKMQLLVDGIREKHNCEGEH